jgi:YHS domain-containing protein
MPELLTDADGLAVGGYDVVSYFSDGGPLEGDATHEVEHAGARYRFASPDNRAAFEADPERYLPSFGGYCPFAVVAMEKCVPPDHKTFRIQDGRLLLFFNDMWEGQMFDTSQKWDEDPQGMLAKANVGWGEVSRR